MPPHPAVAAYADAHVSWLEAQLTRAVDSCMRLRPADPDATAGCGVVGLSATAEAEIRRTPMYAAGSAGRRCIQLSTARESWASSDVTCAFSYAAAAACIVAAPRGGVISSDEK